MVLLVVFEDQKDSLFDTGPVRDQIEDTEAYDSDSHQEKKVVQEPVQSRM